MQTLFRNTVAQFINLDHKKKIYDRVKAKQLANHFEVSEMCVLKWVDGIANPHDKIKQLVMDFISKQ